MLKFYYNGEDLLDDAAKYWNKELKHTRIVGTIVGIVMLILGILCIAFPFSSAYVMEIIASLLILAFGIAEIVIYMNAPIYVRFGGSLISGILNVILGILLLTSPSEELFTAFAFLLAVNLLMVGIEELEIYAKIRFFNASGNGWLMANSIINIIAAVIFLMVPKTSAAFLSLFVAIYLITGGVSLLIGCFNAKELKIDHEVIDV